MSNPSIGERNQLDRVQTTRGVWAGGALAGIIAGLFMAMTAMIRGAVVGEGLWMPFKLIAGTFFGTYALTGGIGVILVGIVTHFAVSALFGVIFAALIRPHSSNAVAFWGGLLYGAVVWLVMTFAVLPLFNEVMRDRIYSAISGWWFFSHFVYGASLIITPRLRARLSRQRTETTEFPRAA